MYEARCQSIGQHKHGVRFIDVDGSCIACRSEILAADNAVLAAEVEAWRALIGPRLVGVLPGPLLVPSLLTQVTHTRHATDASGALDRAKEIK